METREFSILCRRRWAIPVLAAFDSGAPGRVAALAAQLEAGRTVIGQTCEALAQAGYLRPDAGHGPPLRPEYVLAEDGEAVAAWAAGFERALSEIGRAEPARRAWVLPILRELDGPRRFGELRAALRPITDRALSLALTGMVETGWAARTVDPDATPPQVFYTPGPKTTPLTRSLLASFWV